MNNINPDKDILLVEHFWELVLIIKSNNLKGKEGEMTIFNDLYKKISEKPDCPCNKNAINFLENIRSNLDKFLTEQEIADLKKNENVKVIHVRKKDGSILEF